MSTTRPTHSIAVLLSGALVGACGSSAGPPVADDGDAGVEAGASDAAGAVDAKSAAADGAVGLDASAEAGATGFDAGSCCSRDAPYDGSCGAKTPEAFLCYCPQPGPKPPASCVITMGALIVCCP